MQQVLSLSSMQNVKTKILQGKYGKTHQLEKLNFIGFLFMNMTPHFSSPLLQMTCKYTQLLSYSTTNSQEDVIALHSRAF